MVVVVVVVVGTWVVNGRSLSMNRHEGSEPESHSHLKKNDSQLMTVDETLHNSQSCSPRMATSQQVSDKTAPTR